jgi:cytochrome b involved in lipid metabolism
VKSKKKSPVNQKRLQPIRREIMNNEEGKRFLPRKKVDVGGNGLLRWYQLVAQPDFVRNNVHPIASEPKNGLKYISFIELKKHNTQDDCWIVVRGKIYDVTCYLKFHPGGIDKLMLGAGRDATQLFDKYHPWVNIDFLLEKCFIGMLIKEKPTINNNKGVKQELRRIISNDQRNNHM